MFSICDADEVFVYVANMSRIEYVYIMLFSRVYHSQAPSHNHHHFTYFSVVQCTLHIEYCFPLIQSVSTSTLDEVYRLEVILSQ